MIDKIDRSLDPLDQLDQIAEIAASRRTPDWARGWYTKGIEEGRAESRSQGHSEGRSECRAELRHAIWETLCHRLRWSFDPETAQRLTRDLQMIFEPRVLLRLSMQMDRGATDAELSKAIDERLSSVGCFSQEDGT